MIVLALKLAELGLLTERKRTVPVLLLDDVSSELDRTKNARFFEVLEGIGAQVFVTTTHAELIAMDRERTDLRVRGGRVEIA
jgi:DNA replication and repair protein RecF